MDILQILTFIGGLSMFLYGMNVMGAGLQKLAGGRLEKILEKLTTNVSAMPTNISKNCSINSGMIKFRRSLFVNILRLEFLRKSVPAVCQHPFHLCHIPVAEIRRYHGGNSMGVHPQLIV